MLSSRSTLPLILIASCLSLVSCDGGDMAGPQDLDNSPPQQSTPHASAPGFDFPPPSQLPFVEPRNASYTEDSLFEGGYSYETDLPLQNYTEVSAVGEFAASWTNGLSGAAYAMFRFTVDGYDRPPVLRYRWQVAPQPIGSAYIGLANWTEDHWDWWQCKDLGWFNFGDIADYTNPADDTVIEVVVVAGTGVSQLLYTRLGDSGVTADLSAFPLAGIAPLPASLNGSGSSATYSTISNYHWDFDGDGEIDESGTDPATSHTYAEPGTYKPRLTVETSHGEQDAATVKISAYAPWSHSWGGTADDRFHGVATDGDALYVAGSTASFTNNEDTAVLLVKYGLDGEFIWARSWSGLTGDSARGITANGTDGIYTVGDCRSFGAGGSDVLIQRWDADGNLIWTRTWGKSGDESAVAADLSEGMLYVGGNSQSFSDASGDCFLLALDLSGNVIWERTFGGLDNPDELTDVDAWSAFLSPNTTVYTIHNVSTPGDNTLIVLTPFSDDGFPQTGQFWIDGISAYACDLNVSGALSPRIYVSGYQYDGLNQYALLLEIGGNDLAVRWNLGGTATACGAYLIDGSLYVGGTRGTAEQDGFLVQMSSAGALEKATYWSDAASYEEFFGMLRFPGSGLAFCGSADSAAGSWKPLATSIETLAATWGSGGTSVYPIDDSITGSPVQSADDITDGVQDVSADEATYEAYIGAVGQ